MMRADMENVMSGARAANVNFQSWGKFSALNIHCFVLNRLLVVILFKFFYLNIVGFLRVYWKTCGIKNKEMLLFGYYVVKKKKRGINAYTKYIINFNLQILAVLLYVWFWPYLHSFWLNF